MVEINSGGLGFTSCIYISLSFCIKAFVGGNANKDFLFLGFMWVGLFVWGFVLVFYCVPS